MGKHRNKKSFYDVDEDDLKSTDEHYHRDNHRHHHHQRRHHHRRRHESPDNVDEKKKRPKLTSFYSDPRIDHDESALQSPPAKYQQASVNPSTILAELIENPEFLTNSGPKAREFAETARQLLSKPDLDPMTQQIICAMAQAAVNVGKRLSSSSTNSTNQSVDELSVTNSTTYSTTTLLSPTLSNTSSSSTSNTPQQQSNDIHRPEESRTPTDFDHSEDLLIKQMIERAMKLTQQGETQQAQHLLSIIHEKISNKRKRTVDNNSSINEMNIDDEKTQSSSNSTNDHQNRQRFSPLVDSENSSDQRVLPNTSFPPPPPLPPPPPPPPLNDEPNATSFISVPPIEQVQELLSNPSEVQSILKKMFAANEQYKVQTPEEYQIQSHLTSPSSYLSTSSYSLNPELVHKKIPTRLTSTHPSIRPTTPSSTIKTNNSQPYNSSLAFMQTNRPSTNHRSYSIAAAAAAGPSSNSNHLKSLVPSTTPVTSPLIKINSPFTTLPVTARETGSSRWSNSSDSSYYNHPVVLETNSVGLNEQSRNYQPFWCATCALGFPHQIAYQDHLRSHIPCTIPGCSYAASEPLVRIHHQTIHENNLRNRLSNHSSRPIIYQQQTSPENPWPLMRM